MSRRTKLQAPILAPIRSAYRAIWGLFGRTNGLRGLGLSLNRSRWKIQGRTGYGYLAECERFNLEDCALPRGESVG